MKQLYRDKMRIRYIQVIWWMRHQLQMKALQFSSHNMSSCIVMKEIPFSGFLINTLWILRHKYQNCSSTGLCVSAQTSLGNNLITFYAEFISQHKAMNWQQNLFLISLYCIGDHLCLGPVRIISTLCASKKLASFSKLYFNVFQTIKLKIVV